MRMNENECCWSPVHQLAQVDVGVFSFMCKEALRRVSQINGPLTYRRILLMKTCEQCRFVISSEFLPKLLQNLLHNLTEKLLNANENEVWRTVKEIR